jgi:hypothetical protein
VEQAGGLVQIGDVSHVPRAIAGTGTDHVPTAARRRYKNGFGCGFDISVPSNE